MQPDEVIHVVCDALGVAQADLWTKRGPLRIVFARFIAIYCVSNRSNIERLGALGGIFQRHKGTIRYALRQTSDLLETQNPQFAIMFKTAQDAIDRRLHDPKG
jgi:chromosomal replication initiation ATPase DnaA